jgi:ABC-type transporter Mla MlaB component
MKTSKRKRSTKTAPAAEVAGVGAAAETPVVTAGDPPAAQSTEELTPAAVEALVAGPAAEPVAGQAGEQAESVAAESELVADAVAATKSEPATEVVAAALEAVADPAAETVDPNAETIVAEAAVPAATEPATPVEPVVVLSANCSVKDAAALKTSLCALANESTEVTLDVSAVERIDTATMQLLCAFVRDRIGRNQKVAWRGESQALQDAVRLLGVGALLGLEPKGVAA